MNKQNNGITLIALIITIIVLLILAVVAISAVNNTGIVQYAQNSKVAYIDGRDKENGILQGYMEYLDEKDPTKNKTPEGEQVLERIYYVIDDEWAENYVTSEAEVPESATITAKFYKTNTPLQPSLKEQLGEEAPEFDSGYAYKLVIDGKGEMPEILNLDNAGTIGAWGYEIANFLNDMTADNIIPYLTEAEVNGVSNIGAGAFLYFICLRNINISDSVTKIDANASSYCFSLNNFDFKNINYIGNRAFSGTNLKNVIIPDGITTIGVYTFSDSKIESIDLNDIEIVSEAMFIDCDNLINVELGDNTTAIGENAFETCDALQSIDLKNVNSIGSLAFIDCSNLKTIKIKASALSEVGDSVFKNIAAGSKIYVLNQDVKNALEGKYDTSKTTVEIKTLEEMENL